MQEHLYTQRSHNPQSIHLSKTTAQVRVMVLHLIDGKNSQGHKDSVTKAHAHELRLNRNLHRRKT